MVVAEVKQFEYNAFKDFILKKKNCCKPLLITDKI